MTSLRWILGAFAVIGCGCQSAPLPEPVGWTLLPTHSAASLRGLAVVDEKVAYVGGSGGTLLRTLDGGQTWDDVSPPDSDGCDFRDLEAFDRHEVLAMVAGQPARIYRTSDGGSSWRIVHQDARQDAFFDAVAFAGDHGVIFGDALDRQFCLLVSDDAGWTWSDISGRVLPEPKDGEAAFAASGTCLAVADPVARVFSLVTGGGPCRLSIFGRDTQCSYQDLPLQAGAGSKGAFSIAWTGQRAVVVGGDYQAPNVSEGTAALSVDGGLTWSPSNAGGYRSAVVWISDEGLLSVGSHGASLSVDAGRSWRPFFTVGFHSVAKGKDGSVWACGSDGRVARLRIVE